MNNATRASVFFTLNVVASAVATNCYAHSCPLTPKCHRGDYATQAKVDLAKLGPLTGGALDVKVKKTTDSLYAAYPNADHLIIAQAILSGACQIISSSHLSDERKFSLWMEAAREVQK